MSEKNTCFPDIASSMPHAQVKKRKELKEHVSRQMQELTSLTKEFGKLQKKNLKMSSTEIGTLVKKNNLGVL